MPTSKLCNFVFRHFCYFPSKLNVKCMFHFKKTMRKGWTRVFWSKLVTKSISVYKLIFVLFLRVEDINSTFKRCWVNLKRLQSALAKWVIFSVSTIPLFFSCERNIWIPLGGRSATMQLTSSEMPLSWRRSRARESATTSWARSSREYPPPPSPAPSPTARSSKQKIDYTSGQ